ncbi:MAG: phosphocholine cytidylyltransferase family protein [Selenomonadaceae bacterium]|nr:phosphocholine cytidylyltransferase family protein [Selenomonadaceae bacterium]
MTYIILAAGRGIRLNPLTIKNPKALFKLDSETTLIEKTVALIRRYDVENRIVVVVGFQHKKIEDVLAGVEYIFNPFYDVTNSVASLWFARKYLGSSDGTVIINADVMMSESLMREIICQPITRPVVLIDSSIKTNGDYNVEVSDDNILVMSKELEEYYGEYAGVTLLDVNSALKLKDEIISMVDSGDYNQWYENALVRMIFSEDFKLGYVDICDYDWTEIDDVNDLLHAKKIHIREESLNM